ncbi:MAG: DUF5110 domain-containing protein [Treponema sp.]|jgi:alpha-glucosidase|nr:DUF5110 domain-containing protein [Treponema sp.]
MHFSWVNEYETARRAAGSVRTLERINGGAVFRCDEGMFLVDSPGGGVLHLIYTSGENFSGVKSFAVAEGEKEPLEIACGEDFCTFQAGSSVLAVRREDTGMSFRDGTGKTVLESPPNAWYWQKDPAKYTAGAAFRIREGEHFYGMGEKTGFLDKRASRFRMWNTGQTVYTPGADPLGKSIPFLIAYDGYTAYGIFIDKTCNMYIDLGEKNDELFTVDVEDSEMELYFFAGPSIKDVIKRYMNLTGKMDLPPKWALGYQQCRWSYGDEKQVISVAKEFRKRGFPCDVIYLDVDYMDGFRVFTWDTNRFPDPGRMIKELAGMGFRTVVIMETGVKVEGSYGVYTSGVREGVFCAKPGEPPYQTDLWAGKTVFPDFTMEKTRRWWARLQAALLGKGVSGLWVDMNEPTDFSSEAETDWTRATVPGDVMLDHDGQPGTFDQYHNAYGNSMCRAAYESFGMHRPGERPFVVSRAAYAGIQRYACVWTGDNHSWWEHIAAAMPMLMNLGLSGVAFAGSDTGGFQGNATGELFARWMQMGAFTPFFRGHSAANTKPHEPWAFGSEVEEICRKYVKLRYSLMPYLYSEFYECSREGLPVMRPLVLEYPEDRETHELCDEFLFGRSILAAPVYRPAVRRRIVYLPGGTWFDFWTDRPVEGGVHFIAEAPLDTMPLFVRAGAVIPMTKAGDHTGEQNGESLTLELYAGADGDYTLYEDDGVSSRFREGIYSLTEFVLRQKEHSLEFTITPRVQNYQTGRKTYTLRIHGLESPPQAIETAEPRQSHFDGERRMLVMELPDSKRRTRVEMRL